MSLSYFFELRFSVELRLVEVLVQLQSRLGELSTALLAAVSDFILIRVRGPTVLLTGLILILDVVIVLGKSLGLLSNLQL
jgi:hypothetical protein